MMLSWSSLMPRPQSVNLISALDYETQTKLSFTVTIESENADISEIEVLLDVTTSMNPSN